MEDWDTCAKEDWKCFNQRDSILILKLPTILTVVNKGSLSNKQDSVRLKHKINNYEDILCTCSLENSEC